jgi:hypothetical protein
MLWSLTVQTECNGNDSCNRNDDFCNGNTTCRFDALCNGRDTSRRAPVELQSSSRGPMRAPGPTVPSPSIAYPAADANLMLRRPRRGVMPVGEHP